MKNILGSTKKFVVDHKVAIAVSATVVICAAIGKTATNQHDAFLRERGLYEEFYAQID